MVRRFFPSVLIFSFLILMAGAALAETGVILMHGKNGTNKSGSPVGELGGYLENGFIVGVPELPWSRDRDFDKSLEDSFNEIDDVVAKMKAQGATKIVVGGHSLGAAAALAYATSRDGLAGVLMMAPGHRPNKWRQHNEASIERAKSLVAAGKTSERVDIFDKNQGKTRDRSDFVRVAVDWFDPDGPIVMEKNAKRMKPGIPVLLIIGKKDRFHASAKEDVFKSLPPHDKTAYKVVPGGHKATPMKGKSEIRDWLAGL